MVDNPEFIYRARQFLSQLVQIAISKGEQEEWATNLGIAETDGWHQIISALDLLDDTTSAIQHFLLYGLDGPTKYRDTGESYLRLYGILNAIYLQQETVSEVWSLATHKNVNEALKQFQALPIREIRRRLGAHSINIRDNKESYAPIQYSMSGLSCQYVDNAKDWKIQTFDFKEGIAQHYEITVRLLFESVEILLKKANIESEEQKKEFLVQFEDIKILLEGGRIIESGNGTKIKLTVGKAS